jgi:hypothetical protein
MAVRPINKSVEKTIASYDRRHSEKNYRNRYGFYCIGHLDDVGPRRTKRMPQQLPDGFIGQ